MGKVILVIVFVVYYVLCIQRISGNNESDESLLPRGGALLNERSRNRNPPMIESESVGKPRKNSHQNRRSRGHRQKSNKDGLLRHLKTLNNGAYPPLFNVAPRASITANATCGSNGHEEYCRLGDAFAKKSKGYSPTAQCGICNLHSSDPDKNHSIDVILDNSNSWWQSPTLLQGKDNEYVTIVIDLKQTYQIFSIALKTAISPRPASWTLEKSLDGINFTPWQYFGANEDDCQRRYGLSAQTGKHIFTNDREVICTTQYSKLTPMENGELHLSLLKNRPGAENQSEQVLDFITARYIQIRLQGLHTTVDTLNSVDLLLDMQELEKRSFYSFRQIRIAGRLNCHGHANNTIELSSLDKTRKHLVCDCLHNTCGDDCGQCCPLYNNKPFRIGTVKEDNSCEQCLCHGHSMRCEYSEKVNAGICQECLNFTTGNNCELCKDGYFRPLNSSKEEPCVPCQCDVKGSESCDPNSGKCICKDGFFGQDCGTCDQGYVGDDCIKCTCDDRGTINSLCADLCDCKENVEGVMCNQCKTGYFSLSKDNSKGCTKCYCSGVGLSCRETKVDMISYSTLDGWQISDTYLKEIFQTTYQEETESIVFDRFDLFETFDDVTLFWIAPRKYTDNLVKSYGTKLMLDLSWSKIRGDTSGYFTSGPTVILIDSRGERLAYGYGETHEPNILIDIPLQEDNWYQIPYNVSSFDFASHDVERRFASRNQFLTVLNSLQHILIRSSFHTDQVETSLKQVTIMKSSGFTGVGNSVNFVEECVCQTGYTGLSCENCDFGFVRDNGKCVQCPCNGHVENCDLKANTCENCLHSTFGERCERCEVGFYGNPLQGTENDCKRCACPLENPSNNFSPSCQSSNNTELEYICTQCPAGFVGDFCESCDEGFWGNPKIIGSSCRPCECGGGPCDIETGECITCHGHTEGWRCERCKVGYYGNPYEGCTPCDCSEKGSKNLLCDSSSGQCLCKDRFAGQKCNMCEIGFAQFELGCISCNCNINGSILNACDPSNGQCSCKEGVNGLKCDICDDNYYGLTHDGCKECNCHPNGSISHLCEYRSGQCPCNSNVSGRKCDQCTPGHWNLSANGCADCQCDPIGSINFNCNQYTGQCECKPGVTGKKCTECQIGFFGFNAKGCARCDICQDKGFVCDPFNGRCICPPNTSGWNCMKCAPGTFGWTKHKGCRHCECDTVGSIGSTCDISSGQCSCREGFKGLKCDQCAAGYFGYPKCKRCNCNKDGSLAKNGIFDCDSNGNCHCKASVKGEKCTECIGGTFGLSSEHPDGCISCYCFSRSTKCSSSVWSWGHIRMPNARNLSVNYVHPTTVPRDMYEYIVVVQMEGSRSYQGDSEISFMNDLNLIPSSTGNVSIGAYTQFYHPLYFQLPPQFHGDKTLSYSGKLNYSITASGHTQSLNANVLDKFPLAQIHSHTNLIIDYYSYGSSLASTKSLYSIPLHEAFWKHRSNGKPVDRNTFMIALQNIKHIFLRGSTWTDFREIIIEDVHMDHAVYVEGSSNMIATNIERCECPYKYSGLSCQDPGKGFYRLRDTNSTIVEDLIGHSVPCNCNGRSEDCDRETGACKNCRYNTGGEMCEKCAEGFYGDVNINGCKPCPCPEKSKNFAQGCTVDWRGDVQCICKTAYKGYLCDECSEGYFGSPMSNNGTCEPCQCNEKGIQQIGCHPGTGQCFCKAGIKGLRCDVCDAERHYLDGSSCRVCDNCTLSLLDDTDRISSELKRAMKHIDFSGIPAPWLTLDTYDIRANNLFDTYRNFMDSRIGIEDFNTITLNKMELLSEQEAFNAGFLKKYSTANNTVVLEYLSKIKNHLDFAKSLKDGIIATLHILNNYGNSNNFLNLPSALKQAYFFLQNIEAHENDMHKVKNIISCSTIFHDKFDYLNTELEKSRDDILRINERLKTFNRQVHDIGHLSDKILEDHSEIADILTHVENYIHHFNDNKATLQALLTELDNAQYKNVNQLTKETLNKVKQNLNNMKIVRANLEDIREPTNKSLHANNELYKQVRKHWLPKAWKHTTRLMEKAIKYENLFQPTKDASKMALKASSVYENIIEAIKNAKEAVTEAVESVRSAEMKLYPNHGNSVIYNSKQSLNYSKALQTDAMKKMEQVEHYNKRINHHVEAVETITNTLVNAGNKLNDISLAASTISKHNLRKSISESSHKADDIIDKMKRESQGLTSILDNFSDMKEKLKHLKPATGSRLGGVQDNLTQAFSNIRHAKMDLDDLEVRSKKDSQKFEVWNSSFAKELQELKDSIAQARHAAESIKISIESLDSSCVRSYGPPVLGLSTSNSLKMLFSLNTSSPNSPLLYIEGSQNHFMSLELFRRKIRFVWNLGGKTAEVTHDLEIKPQDPNYAEAWYYIEANRTLNIGSLAVRQMNNYGFLKNSDIVTGSSDSENTRFIRTAKNKIWLGGIPNNSPRNGVMSSGLNVIVNEVFVDNKPLGLWNFDSTKGSCLASKKGAYNPESRSKERYFDGGGYSEVKKTRSRYYRKNLFELQMWFKTLDEDALLFLAIDNKNNRSVSVTLHEGRVIFRVEYGNESRLEINTTNRYNIGSWVKIETAREFKHKRGTENGVLRVNDDIISSGSPNLPIKSHMLPDLSDSVYYLGGVPPGFKSGVTKAPGADNPFMGCMKDITIDRESFDPLETSSLFGVEAGCKTSVSKAGFVGEGFVEYKSHSLRKRSNVGFVFRTLQSESLLLLSAYPPETREDYDTKDIKGNYSISIVDGFINIVVNSGFDLVKLKSNTTVNDGEYHVINLIKMDRRISLMIDDELHSSKTITGSLQTINMPEDSGGLYIGGAPMQTDYSSIVPTTTRLIGAIRDIVINNRTVMFTEALNFSHVLIGRDGPSMGLLDVYMKTEPIGNSFTVAPEGCHRVGSYSYEKNAFKFGDSLNSFSKVFMQGKRFWQGNFEFSFDLRTFYPNGIILFSEGTKNKRKHFVTLILKDGHLNFIMRGRRKEELKLTAKLNNGDWHHISLVCVDRKLTMSVELGKTDQKTSAQLKIGKKISVSNMIYVGGISNNSSDSNMGSDIKNKIGNFKGCLRSFLIDNKARDLAFPENHSNIGQCFPKVEKGSFFAGDAYVLYKKSFNIGKYASFNLNFKTSELNGVIMSGSESPSFPAISLELMDGKVIFSIDTGNTKIQRIESNLPSKYMICDNKWHNLSALYDNEQLILGIDNFSFQTSLNMNPETIQARVNLYIGGLPDSATTGILLGKDNFKGCIKNVIIKNERTDWVDMEELHNVLLSECVVDS